MICLKAEVWFTKKDATQVMRKLYASAYTEHDCVIQLEAQIEDLVTQNEWKEQDRVISVRKTQKGGSDGKQS